MNKDVFSWGQLSVCLLIAGLPATAMSQVSASVVTESRDASSAAIGTLNFTVGRLARDCLSILNRPETAKEFLAVWQQRNAKYLSASIKYMGKRLDEAKSTGGDAGVKAVLGAYQNAISKDGGGAVQDWFSKGKKEEVCQRAISIIEAGGMDISSKMPMYDELESLSVWAAE
jgi:hypothetical protein